MRWGLGRVGAAGVRTRRRRATDMPASVQVRRRGIDAMLRVARAVGGRCRIRSCPRTRASSSLRRWAPAFAGASGERRGSKLVGRTLGRRRGAGNAKRPPALPVGANSLRYSDRGFSPARAAPTAALRRVAVHRRQERGRDMHAPPGERQGVIHRATVLSLPNSPSGSTAKAAESVGASVNYGSAAGTGSAGAQPIRSAGARPGAPTACPTPAPTAG